uniref:Chromo domain-containing protein n=1 Tax=Plectus sambesii TaxID=2011161 RepID=A0A914VSF8_9BILA
MSSPDGNEKPVKEDEEFMVERIIGHKTAAELRDNGEAKADGPDDKLYFRVRWLGYAEEDDTWEDATSLDNNTVFVEYIGAHNLREQIGQSCSFSTPPLPLNTPEGCMKMEIDEEKLSETTTKFTPMPMPMLIPTPETMGTSVVSTPVPTLKTMPGTTIPLTMMETTPMSTSMTTPMLTPKITLKMTMSKETLPVSSDKAPLSRLDSFEASRKLKEDAYSTAKPTKDSSLHKSPAAKASTSSDSSVVKKNKKLDNGEELVKTKKKLDSGDGFVKPKNKLENTEELVKTKKRLENDESFDSAKKKRKETKPPEPVARQIESSLDSTIDSDASYDSVIHNSQGEEVYVVRKIVDHNPLGFCKSNHLVRWEGYGKEDDTWEPDTNLVHLDVFKSYIAKYTQNIEKCRKRWSEKMGGGLGEVMRKLEEKKDIFSSRSRSVDSDEVRQRERREKKEKEKKIEMEMEMEKERELERRQKKERKRREKELREKELLEAERRNSQPSERERHENERLKLKENGTHDMQKKTPPPASRVEGDSTSAAIETSSLKHKKLKTPLKSIVADSEPVKSLSHSDAMLRAGSRSSSPVPKQKGQRLDKSNSASETKNASKKAESVVIEASISTDNDKVPDDVFRTINPTTSTVPTPVAGVSKIVSFRYNNADHTVPIDVLEQFLSKAREIQTRAGLTAPCALDHQPLPSSDLTELFRKQLRVSAAPLEAKQKILDRFKREADSEKSTWSRRLLMAIRSGDFGCFQTTLEKSIITRTARDPYFKNKSRDVVSQAIVLELLRETTDQEVTLLMTLAWSADIDNPCGDSNGHQTCRILETLLSIGCSRYLDKQSANSRRSALMIAAKYGQPCQVAVLVRYGAIISLRDCFGQTALHYAAERGHMQIMKWLVWHGGDLTLVGGSARTGRLMAEDVARHPLNGHIQVGEWLMQRRLALERITAEWVRDVCADVICPHRPVTQIRVHRVADQVTPRQQLITFVLDDYESLLQTVKIEHGENIRPFLFIFAAQYSRAENEENRSADNPAFYRIAAGDKRLISLLQMPIAVRAGRSVQLRRMDLFGSNTNSWSFAFSLLASGETVLKLSFDLPEMASSMAQRALLVVQPWFCTVNDIVPR